MKIPQAIVLGFLVSFLLCGCGNRAEQIQRENQDTDIQQLKLDVRALQSALAEDEQIISNLNSRVASISSLQSSQLVDQLNDDEKSGRLTHDQAEHLRDVMSGKIPMYVRPDGTLTTNQTGP